MRARMSFQAARVYDPRASPREARASIGVGSIVTRRASAGNEDGTDGERVIDGVAQRSRFFLDRRPEGEELSA